MQSDKNHTTCSVSVNVELNSGELLILISLISTISVLNVMFFKRVIDMVPLTHLPGFTLALSLFQRKQMA